MIDFAASEMRVLRSREQIVIAQTGAQTNTVRTMCSDKEVENIGMAAHVPAIVAANAEIRSIIVGNSEFILKVFPNY